MDFVKFVVRHVLISCCLIFVYSSTIVAKLYLENERTNLSCHYDRNDSNIFNNETLKEIDRHLDELYSLVNTTGAYGDNCTVDVSMSFNFLSNKTSQQEATKEITVQIAHVLESLETRRARYEYGKWGYCGKEGAEELISNITALKKTASSMQIVLCDRAALLICHERHKKCVCIVDNKNFRETAADYWNDTKEVEEGETSMNKSQCLLVVGSDCAVEDASKFRCNPMDKCLMKNTHKPCTIKSFAEDFGSPNTPITRNTNETENYRFIRDDYPNIHCQCYKYVGRDSYHPNALGEKLIINRSVYLLHAVLVFLLQLIQSVIL